MGTQSSNLIEHLIQWQGGWASRSLYDNCIERILSEEKQDFELANSVFLNASGYSAHDYLIKYKQLSNFQLSKLPKLSIDESVKQLISLNQIGQIPYELSYNYWIDKLCKHLNCSRNELSDNLSAFQNNEPLAIQIEDVSFLLKSWSFPIIFKILNIEPFSFDFDYIENEYVSNAWKRWFMINGKSILTDTKDKSSLKLSQWIVWRLIHDATHLIHLQLSYNNKSYYDPEWLLSMEGVSMYVEYEFLNLLDNNSISLPITINTNLNELKTVLLLGFVERSMRMDFDLEVHLYEKSIFDWKNEMIKETGLNYNLYSFAKEFHGLPGFASCYMLGLWAYKNENDKLDVLKGLKVLNFFSHRIPDTLSNSMVTDIPSKEPRHALKIDKVGTTRNTGYALLLNPFLKKYITSEIHAKMFISLDEQKKGIHMSRLQEAIVNIPLEREFNSLIDVSQYILDEIQINQIFEKAEVHISTNSFVESEGNLSRKKSRQPLKIISSIIQNDCGRTYRFGIKIRIMTACPCTLEYSKQDSMRNRLYFEKDKFNNNEFIPHMYTHSQAGFLTVIIESSLIQFDLLSLYRKINKAVHLVESVLKRADEHFIVLKNHTNPMFCEDVCREVAISVATILNEFDIVEVTAELEESIHPHIAYAQLKMLAKDIIYKN